MVAARDLGKTKTVFQMVGLSALLLRYPYEVPGFGFVLDFHQLGMLCVYVSVLFSLLSGADYFFIFFQRMREAARTP